MSDLNKPNLTSSYSSLKNQNLFRVISRDTSATKTSVYVLQCSTPYENVLKNSDPHTHSYAGTILAQNI